MEISIKKPCHENWDAMTPNEQGAFCGKCVKTVIDFSTKSLEEIKDFFAGNAQQKVCGRFEEQQLTALSFDAFFERFKHFEFTKRLAVILFFTFGVWLFGASNAMGQTNAHLKGDVQVVEPVQGTVMVVQPKDTTKCVKPNNNNHTNTTKIMGKVAAPVKPVPDKQPVKMGEVKALPPKTKPTTPKK